MVTISVKLNRVCRRVQDLPNELEDACGSLMAFLHSKISNPISLLRTRMVVVLAVPAGPVNAISL
jgi:hypothetical protein